MKDRVEMTGDLNDCVLKRCFPTQLDERTHEIMWPLCACLSSVLEEGMPSSTISRLPRLVPPPYRSIVICSCLYERQVFSAHGFRRTREGPRLLAHWNTPRGFRNSAFKHEV